MKLLRNYAFIDSQNVNLSVQHQGWRLDWKKLRVYLKEKYSVLRAYIFIGFVSGNEDLYSFLKDSGYILVFKEAIPGKPGKLKGNCDAELVLQVMIDFPHYEKAILLTGDGDFACVLRYLIQNEKLERIIVPNIEEYSSLIKKAAPAHIDSLNHLRQKLAYIKRTQLRTKP